MRKIDCGYFVKHEWPDDAYLQGNDYGIVLSKNSYETAFFEVFPKNPKTFIRGEGKTLEEAETQAWKFYQKIINCSKHDFVRRDESNHGICKNCNLFMTEIFETCKKCPNCNKEAYFFYQNPETKDEKYYCLEHFFEKLEIHYKDTFKNKKIINFIFEEKAAFNWLIHGLSQYILIKNKLKHDKYLKMTEHEIYLREENNDFITFFHNLIVINIKSLKDIYKFSIMSSSRLKDYIKLNDDYMNTIVKLFLEKNTDENIDVKNMVHAFVQDYDNYFFEKYGNSYTHFININQNKG
jgi:hypothetical protein